MSNGTSILSNNPLQKKIYQLHTALREINKAVECMSPSNLTVQRASIQRMVRLAMQNQPHNQGRI
jgi:hypothetical protein